MKNTFYSALLYIGLALFIVSCQKDAPEPECLQIEVIGEDCETGWFLLKIENTSTNGNNNYLGQLHNGYVTTDNLPAQYQQPGLRLNASLELNGEYAPRCVAIAVMYPAVKVTRLCGTVPSGD
ncbi:hypothetical protein WG947_12990 [Pontibacter sp. H259]|uniref:hypothetical protein n=1 Tax=Pontibacter sp. H259 TaxID=3133421 RepID=UPI0030BCA26C